jgi:hypothetical protein
MQPLNMFAEPIDLGSQIAQQSAAVHRLATRGQRRGVATMRAGCQQQTGSVLVGQQRVQQISVTGGVSRDMCGVSAVCEGWYWEGGRGWGVIGMVGSTVKKRVVC